MPALAVPRAIQCDVDGCRRYVHPRHRKCPMHEKRVTRGKPMDTEAREQLSPWAMVLEASIAHADTDAEDDLAYARACDRLRKAIETWVAAKGGGAR